MRRFAKPAGALLAVLYLIVQFLALGIDDKKPLRAPERIIVMLTAPLQALVERTVDRIGDGWQHYFALVGTSKKNEELKAERNELFGSVIKLREFEAENQRLRRLLELREVHPLQLLAAERVASGISPYERTIRINRGSNEGVVSGSAVLHPRGAVGQVSEVFADYADVLLLVDIASAIDVVCQRSRARGLLRGENLRELRFEYLPKNQDVVVGDVVVTSGLDGVYPKGLPIGVVSFVDKSKQELFLTARVRPFVDFTRLEEVSVVLRGDE